MKEFQKTKYKGDYSDFESVFIDSTTMEIHQEKHHEGYRVKLNDALKDLDQTFNSVEDLLKNINQVPEDLKASVINNGGGLANHNLFFSIITPEKTELKESDLKQNIIETFGSVEAFQTEFSAAATSRFGSGWAWLVVTKEDNLEIISTPNQNSPLMEGNTPILGLDVWEHAYYLHYQNRRPDYVTAFWNVVDWDKIEGLYQEIKE